jgi:hypothetical protein
LSLPPTKSKGPLLSAALTWHCRRRSSPLLLACLPCHYRLLRHPAEQSGAKTPQEEKWLRRAWCRNAFRAGKLGKKKKLGLPLVCGMLSREAFTDKQTVNNDKDCGQQCGWLNG